MQSIATDAVAWSVCLSARWSCWWALKKWRTDGDADRMVDSDYPKHHVLDGARYTNGKDNFGGLTQIDVNVNHCK